MQPPGIDPSPCSGTGRSHSQDQYCVLAGARARHSAGSLAGGQSTQEPRTSVTARTEAFLLSPLPQPDSCLAWAAA